MSQCMVHLYDSLGLLPLPGWQLLPLGVLLIETLRKRLRAILNNTCLLLFPCCLSKLWERLWEFECGLGLEIYYHLKTVEIGRERLYYLISCNKIFCQFTFICLVVIQIFII